MAIGDFGTFPKNVYPVGRLDADSEGLLLLTNDNTVNHRIADPKFEHPRTYWAQVEGIPTDDALEQLRCGMIIEKQKTKPADYIGGAIFYLLDLSIATRRQSRAGYYQYFLGNKPAERRRANFNKRQRFPEWSCSDHWRQ